MIINRLVNTYIIAIKYKHYYNITTEQFKKTNNTYIKQIPVKSDGDLGLLHL